MTTEIMKYFPNILWLLTSYVYFGRKKHGLTSSNIFLMHDVEKVNWRFFLILMFVLSHTWARHNLEFGKILFWLIDRTGSDTKYCDKNLFLALGSISISTIAPRPLPHYTVFQHPANFGTKVAQSWSYFPSNTNRESVKIMILQVVFNLKGLNVAPK